MTSFHTMHLPTAPDVVAPDGSDVRILLALHGGSMAHFELAPGQTSASVAHRTVEEIWYFLRGRGEMWRKLNEQEEVVAVTPGVCLTVPVGTHFQFRSFGPQPLAALGVTMPPWPGEDEAYPVPGKWPPSVLHPSPLATPQQHLTRSPSSSDVPTAPPDARAGVTDS